MLIINGLNILIKRQIFYSGLKKQHPIYAVYKKCTLNIKKYIEKSQRV